MEKSETENAPSQIFKTIQKGRRQSSDSVNYYGASSLQYVSKAGFQDFLQ